MLVSPPRSIILAGERDVLLGEVGNHVSHYLRNHPMRTALILIGLVLGVFIYAWLRPRSEPKLTIQDAIAEMESRAKQAVLDAKSEYAANLDYSPASVETVESILAQLHQQHIENPISEAELIRHALKWGGYIGEVIKQVHTAEWQIDSEVGGEGSLPIVYEDNSESFPVRWCYKRIVNGEEDNVWHKFTVFVLNRDSLDKQDGSGAEDEGEQ